MTTDLMDGEIVKEVWGCLTILACIGTPGIMYAGVLTYIFWIFSDDRPVDEERGNES